MMKFSDLGIHENYHPESEWMVSEVECETCGDNWVAVHPICEKLQCKNKHWIEVPPLEPEE